MNEDFSIEVKSFIVHILDNNTGVPVLSEHEHPESDEAMEFIEKHILKVLKDDSLKTACFTEEAGIVKNICKNIYAGGSEFSGSTREIGEFLYNLMQKYPDIPSADLVCSLFDLDGDMHLGILKLNYKPSFIHYVGGNSSGTLNSIIKQKTTLPGESQKIEECALINLKDLSIKMLEKKYEINGEKIFYFSTMFLQCAGDMSDRDKVKVFKRATESFNKKYCKDDFTVQTGMRRAVADSIEEEEAIDIEKVAEDVFKRNPDMRDIYIDHMEKAGFREKTISVNQEISEKVFKRHKIKTDTGIEINLPVDYYKDNEKVEFINNPDGTISIVLKNISSITDCR